MTTWGKTPVYSAASTNNGIIGTIDKKPDFIVDKRTPNYIVFGDHTRSFNIASESFCVMDNVKVLRPKEIYSIKALLYIISAWRKCIPNKGYSRHWSIAQNVKISLPITSSNKIDLEFMESFIAELEAERIAELEAERIAELYAYLLVSGFDNYELTSDEEKTLKAFKTLEFKEYNMEEMFDILSYKKRFDANKVNIHQTGKHPYIVRMSLNNGQRGYIDADEKYLNDGNTISFGQDTATMFYQEKPYFTGDKIKILKAIDNRFNKKNAQYFLTVMAKSFSLFSWGSSKFDIETIKRQKFLLPIKSGEPDFEFMENFISAVKKLVIKDVVLYADRKIDATKNIVNKSTNKN